MPRLLSIVRHAFFPFSLHLFSTVFSMLATLYLIVPTGAGRVYNVKQRRPLFVDLDGWPRAASLQNAKLLQSDITLIISLLASATRVAGAWWAGKLLWRCGFMFMEKSEITLAGFFRVISGGITTLLSPRHVSSKKNWLLIYAVILICFVVDYFSVILRGSLTWHPVVALVDGVVPLRNLTEGIPGSNLSVYRSRPQLVSQVIDLAASLAQVSWGILDTNSPDVPIPSKLTRRAVIQAANVQSIQYLPNGSALGSIQLPYFKVEKFEYITDPDSKTLTSQQWSLLNDSSPYNPYLPGDGFITLFPDASWGPGSSLSLPFPVTVSEFRILAIQVESPAVPRGTPLLDSTVPQDVNPYLTSIVSAPSSYSCLIFANVTFTAGAAICQHCKIISPTIVQGHMSNLRPIPDPLTIEALAITASVMGHMSSDLYAIPVINGASTYQDIAIELVSRAYQAAWSSLVIVLGGFGQHNQTNVMVAVPASHLDVLGWRVFLWAVLNIAVLLGGIASVYFQSRFRHP